MGLFGNSEDSAHSISLWSRLTKHRKQEQKPAGNIGPTSQLPEKPQKQQHQLKPPVIRISEDSKRENFRLSLQSLRPRTRSNSNSLSQNRASCLGSEQLDSRLRTSKLQCEQLKRKVATISLECSKLENQCREIAEVKEQLLSFHSDVAMLKSKEKVSSEIQQRVGHLEEEHFSMMDQIEHLRLKLSELKTEIKPEFIQKRLEKLEADGHKLTTITLQNRRDHDRFSLDVGNQLVETFVTQQTIYEEFRRLQHRLISVERQNQIMSDLIHFHCHNSVGTGNSILMINSDSSRGAGSLLASTEVASSSFSPSFSDRDAEKANTSPSDIDWQFTDQADSLFLCDTLNKSSEGNKESLMEDIKKDYYKIDFTSKSESLVTLQRTALSETSLGPILSNEEVATASPTPHVACTTGDTRAGAMRSIFEPYSCDRKEIVSIVSNHKDDGYYSTSHDGTMATDRTLVSDSVVYNGKLTVFQDDKERYFILTRHVQKSRGRSLRTFPISKSSCTLMIKSSLDLETHLSNRSLRERQHKQRDSQASNEDDITQVFSDTELYGTRFCIDSDIDEEETPAQFYGSKLRPLRRGFDYPPVKLMKTEPRLISNLPPLIEHVSERERRIEIKATKKSKIVPPRARPKASSFAHITDRPKSTTRDPMSLLYSPNADDSNITKQMLSIKPPKYSPTLNAPKTKFLEASKLPTSLSPPRKSHIKRDMEKPPPVPPRPKKNFEVEIQFSRQRNLTSIDYVNDPATRMSPEGCQDLQGGNSQVTNQFRDFNAPVVWRKSFSPTLDECYIEDEEDVKIVRPENFEEYYDQEFISELENYQLPKSTVNMLVMQHFK